MQKVINRGFTLIELLVVIAIIGILAAIVLVSLGNARQKGADAGIQGNLASIRTQAEVFSSNNSNGYGAEQVTTACAAGLFGDATINAAINSAQTASGGTATCVSSGPSATTGETATTWAVSVPLKSDSAREWCVDSSGNATSTLATGGATVSSNVARCVAL
jgi:prepilin-type N-terminal cleavage/methylation domain-containing protein